MLNTLFSGNMLLIVLSLFSHLVVLLLSNLVHECAHALAAKALGDDTAERMGRLTLNPFSHIDPLGAIGIMLFGVGWAKPVPINPNRCHKVKSRKTAMALTAAAGPLANVLIALVFVIITKLILINVNVSANTTMYYVCYALNDIIEINLYLAVFNLVPIPPFDGSRLLLAFLPEKYYFGLMRYERYIMIAILILMYTGILSLPLHLLSNLIYSFLDLITSFLG